MLLTLPPKHLSSLNSWNRLEEEGEEHRKIEVPLKINNCSGVTYLCHSLGSIHFLGIKMVVRNKGYGARLPGSESQLFCYQLSELERITLPVWASVSLSVRCRK